MDLLERDDLFHDLGRFWDGASTGQGRIVFIGGEAGVGKTSLVRAFRERIGESARQLIGMCDPLSTPRPLGPLVDMAAGTEDHLTRLLAERAPRDRLLPGVLADLRGQPALVIVEDVHWADEATLDLIRYLGRRIDTVPTLLLATYRDDELSRDHPLHRVLGDLATAPGAHRLTIEPLSEAAVADLASGSEFDPRSLHRKTGGNPFYVTEILLSGNDGIPGTVRDAVLARISRLPPSAADVLAAAAVIGSPIDPWLLTKVTGDNAAALDDCIDSGVLGVAESGYLFRHEIARETVYDSIPVHQRLSLHRAVLDALLSRAGGALDAARLAHHAEAAEDRDLVLTYAPVAAAKASSLNAHREAAAQYRRALRFAGELPATGRAHLLEALAQECFAISSLEEGISVRDVAIAIWSDIGNDLMVAGHLSEKAGLLVLSGRNKEAEAASKAAVELAESLPEDRRLGQIFRLQAHIRMLNRDTEEAVRWGERALAVAERFDDREVIIGAENAVGSALLVAGEIDAGRARLERSLSLAQGAGSDQSVSAALVNLGSGTGEMHRFRMARDYLDKSIAYSAERDLDMHRWYSASWLALCHLHLGDWPAAARTAIDVLRRPVAPPIGRMMALLALGRLRARRGDPDVWEALDEALALAEPTGTLQRLGPIHAARAEAAWLVGDPERTAREAGSAYDLALEHRHSWFVGELAYWQWKAGSLVSGPAGAAEPYALQIAGDWAGAAAAWKELGCPYEAARALAESGEEDALRESHRTFERLGAMPAAAMAAKTLRHLGARHIPRGPRATTRTNPAHLTAREVDVVRLMIAGRRNAEIADELFLSPKTIEHHVTSILAKLGVSSRTEAIRAAQALGIGG